VTWQTALLVVHILAAMAWVGGGLVIQFTQRRVFRLGGWPAFDRVRADLAWADTWLAIPAPLLVVGTGIAMVVLTPGWRFTQTWIWMSMVAVVLYQVLAFTVGTRLYRQLETTHEDGGAKPASSLLKLGDLLLTVLVGVVFLMVFKPGLH